MQVAANPSDCQMLSPIHCAKRPRFAWQTINKTYPVRAIPSPHQLHCHRCLEAMLCKRSCPTCPTTPANPISRSYHPSTIHSRHRRMLRLPMRMPYPIPFPAQGFRMLVRSIVMRNRWARCQPSPRRAKSWMRPSGVNSTIAIWLATIAIDPERYRSPISAWIYHRPLVKA